MPQHLKADSRFIRDKTVAIICGQPILSKHLLHNRSASENALHSEFGLCQCAAERLFEPLVARACKIALRHQSTLYTYSKLTSIELHAANVYYENT